MTKNHNLGDKSTFPEDRISNIIELLSAAYIYSEVLQVRPSLSTSRGGVLVN